MSLDLIVGFIFLLTIVERFIELLISKRNAAWSFRHGGVEYGANHYKWMVIMHGCFLVMIPLEFIKFGAQISDEIRILALVSAFFCQVLRWWIIKTLGRQWNTRVIVVPGMQRVRCGPYKLLNHPNYVVVAIEALALPLMFGAWRTAIIFSALNTLLMIARISTENAALLELK